MQPGAISDPPVGSLVRRSDVGVHHAESTRGMERGTERCRCVTCVSRLPSLRERGHCVRSSGCVSGTYHALQPAASAFLTAFLFWSNFGLARSFVRTHRTWLRTCTTSVLAQRCVWWRQISHLRSLFPRRVALYLAPGTAVLTSQPPFQCEARHGVR